MNIQNSTFTTADNAIAAVGDRGLIHLTSGTLQAQGQVLVEHGGKIDGTGSVYFTGTQRVDVSAGGQVSASAVGIIGRPLSAPLNIDGTGSSVHADTSLELNGGTTTVSSGAVLSSDGQMVLGGNRAEAALTVDQGSVSVAGQTTWGDSGGDATVTFRNNSVGTFADLVLAGGTLFGGNGTATASVESGSQLTVDGLRLTPLDAGGSSTLTVTGAGSAIMHGSSGAMPLTVGNNPGGGGIGAGPPAEAILNILDGAVVDTGTGSTTVYHTGTINLDGGTLSTKEIIKAGSTFNFIDGTLEITGSNGFALGGATILGNNFTLGEGQTLIVAHATTLPAGTSLVLNGGTFNTGTLVKTGGTFTFTSGTLESTLQSLAVGGAGALLGNTLNLTEAKILVTSNGQGVNVNSGGTINLNGGTLHASHLQNAGTVNVNSGDVQFGITGAGGAGLVNQSTGRMNVAAGAVVNSTGPITNSAGGRVTLQGGTSQVNAALTNNGLVQVTGEVTGAVTNNSSGELRATLSDTLLLSGAGNTSTGRITLAFGGTVESPNGLTNAVGGRISGDGIVRVGQLDLDHSPAHGGTWQASDTPLFQRGTANFTGHSEVIGDVWMQGTAATTNVIASGTGNLEFFDDVYSYKTGATAPEIRAGAGSTITYFGELRGNLNLTGSGEHVVEGTLHSGFSPGYTFINANFTLAGASNTIADLAGTLRMDGSVSDTSNHYTAYDFGQILHINDGATFTINEIFAASPHTAGAVFSAQLGDQFNVLTWTQLFRNVNQTFDPSQVNVDFTGAPLAANRYWQVNWNPNSLVLQVVPEPSSLCLGMLGLAGLMAMARRKRWIARS